MQASPRTVLFVIVIFLIVSQPCAWAHTDVTVAQAQDLIDTVDDLMVVDVREPYEYCDARGHIPGSLNYPLSSGVLQARYEELPPDRPILVVCRSGGRSNQAANFLDSQGFPDVYDMIGGMGAWTGETAPCKYAGGSGTADDPYRIATAADLIALGETPDDYDKHFQLTADIDLSEYTYDRAVIAPDTNDAEDWFQGIAFNGVLDGGGHAILHLTITGGSCLGLFGRIGDRANISKLDVEGVDVTGVGNNLGGLCGMNGGTICECRSAGSVTGGDYSSSLGGLAGMNSGTISRCKATASVTAGSGASWLGGLCGANSGGTGVISDCYAAGSVTGGDRSAALGGLCGDNWGTISVCYTTVSVTGGDNSGGLGGLCGGNFGDVHCCFWDRQTCGTLYSSGGWGMSTADMMTESTYTGWDNGAWVIDEGQDYPRLAWENTPGTIIAYEYPRSYSGNGEDQPFVLERPEDIVCLALRPADWGASFVLAGDVNMLSVPDYRPVGLFTGKFHGRDHVVENLTIDADLMGNRNQLGLFGRIGHAGQVTDLRLLAATVTGPDYSLCLGGLCGQNDGTVSDCYAGATVTGGQFLGGLCGDNGEGIISNSHATGRVTGGSYLGGLCGTNAGTISACHTRVNVRRDGAGYSPSLGGLVGSNFNTISNCYAVGTVTGGNNSENLGGLVGENSWGGTISNCYATGSVSGGMWRLGGLCGMNWGNIAASFWDMGTSGQATSAGGMGKATSEMQTISIFLEAGWDFMDETANGTDDIWWIAEGQGYPRLWWERADAEF